MHDRGIIHRDIKPQNVVLDNDSSEGFHLIDFGLSKHYLVRGQHISYKENKGMVGTPKFCSKWTMQGLEQSRRDDLYSLGYMVVYLLKGSLPWGNIGVSGNKQEKLKKISYLKSSTSVSQVCFECPPVLFDYLNYVDRLRFEDTPNYDYLLCLFTSQVKMSISAFLIENKDDYDQVKKQLENWVELERMNLNSSLKISDNVTNSNNSNNRNNNGKESPGKKGKGDLRVKLQKQHLGNPLLEPIKTVYAFQSHSMNLKLK